MSKQSEERATSLSLRSTTTVATQLALNALL